MSEDDNPFRCEPIVLATHPRSPLEWMALQRDTNSGRILAEITKKATQAANREAELICEEAVRNGDFVPGETKLVIVDGWPIGYQKPGEGDEDAWQRLTAWTRRADAWGP